MSSIAKNLKNLENSVRELSIPTKLFGIDYKCSHICHQGVMYHNQWHLYGQIHHKPTEV